MLHFPQIPDEVREQQKQFDAEARAIYAEFTLANDPPTPRRATFDNLETTRQRVLVEGMDCLPDQLDLF